jgi:class 3 adenylate cyclase/HEAT repeat protein
MNEEATDDEVLSSEGAGAKIVIDVALFSKGYENANPEKRVKYIESCVRYDTKETLPFLCSRAACDETPEVRATLAISIGVLGDESQIPVVGSFLKDEDPRVRANAIEGLEYIDSPKTMPLVLGFLSDPDNRIRANVIKSMKKYGIEGLYPVLQKMVTSPSVWMRDSAVYCMCNLQSPALFPLLEKAYGDPEESIRKKAESGLKSLAAKGVLEAADLLGISVDTLDASADENPVDESDGSVTLDKPLSPLQSEDAGERKEEIDRIVSDHDSSQNKALIDLLATEEDHFLQACVVTALGVVGDQSAVEPLFKCLTSDLERIRANAIEALAALAPVRLLELSNKLLTDENNRVRANAIVALFHLNREDALIALRKMVNNDDELYRRSAFWAIVDIGTDDTIEFWKNFLTDENEEIRTRAVHHIHQLQDLSPDYANDIISSLDPKCKRLLAGDVATEKVVVAFEEEMPEQTKKFKYSSFVNLKTEDRLEMIDEAKANINVANYYFLREVLQKEKDFVVKVAARRGLKNFDNNDFGSEALIATDNADFLETPEIIVSHYQGVKTVLILSRELVVKAKKQSDNGYWEGPFGQNGEILNALREDTQDMIAAVLKNEEVVAVAPCYFNDRMVQFSSGQNSLDMTKYAKLVNLSGPVGKMDLLSPSRAFLSSIPGPVYLLVILTSQKCSLFLRGALETKTCAHRTFHYRQISRIALNSLNDTVSIELTVAGEIIEIPHLERDAGLQIHNHLKKESIGKIKSEERFIDIDFAESLKKLEILKAGGVISEAEYCYRKDRVLKMDSEKFSTENVNRILTRRYTDDKLAKRMDQELMNRFKDELTIMFTDIVGYSKKTTEKQMLDLLTILAIHDGLLLPKVELHNGSLIKKIGDALMVSFKDPDNAVSCGLAMQEALDKFNSQNDDDILIRIGINTGEVFVKDGDIFGEAVNNANAMESFCEPARVLVSESTYIRLSDSFKCEKQGTRILKTGKDMVVYLIVKNR